MRPAVRFIRIVAIFLLIGPPAGVTGLWAAALSITLLHGELGPLDLGTLDYSNELRGMLAIILFSYLIGGPFALACGIAHAVSAIWLRRNSVWVPLIASAVLSAVFMLVWHPADSLPKLEDVIITDVAPMLTASLICWRVSRPLLRGA